MDCNIFFMSLFFLTLLHWRKASWLSGQEQRGWAKRRGQCQFLNGQGQCQWNKEQGQWQWPEDQGRSQWPREQGQSQWPEDQERWQWTREQEQSQWPEDPERWQWHKEQGQSQWPEDQERWQWPREQGQSHWPEGQGRWQWPNGDGWDQYPRREDSRKCPKLNSPKAGSIRCHKVPKEETCASYCLPGYRFKGGNQRRMVLTCRNGVWRPQSEFPDCVSDGSCKLKIVGDGNIACEMNSQGKFCDVWCNGSYRGKFHCIDDNWKPSLPRCVRPRNSSGDD